MATKSETKRAVEDATHAVPTKGPSPRGSHGPTAAGIAGDGGDEAAHHFYSSSISDSYRRKSELVSQQLAEIGMGKYVGV